MTDTLGQAYAWTTDWICPVCSHTHSKPHFAFKDQVDLNKEPNVEGRVKYGREEKHDVCSDETGPVEIKGLQQGLFCPHCGYIQELIHIIKTGVKKK